MIIFSGTPGWAYDDPFCILDFVWIFSVALLLKYTVYNYGDAYPHPSNMY